jgi:hypothetical protein
MISVAVLYPNKAGSKFDLDYYVHRHLPLVRDRLKPMGDAVTDLHARARHGPCCSAAALSIVRRTSVRRYGQREPRAPSARGGDAGRHPQLHRRCACHLDRRGSSGLILCESRQAPGAAIGRCRSPAGLARRPLCGALRRRRSYEGSALNGCLSRRGNASRKRRG